MGCGQDCNVGIRSQRACLVNEPVPKPPVRLPKANAWTEPVRKGDPMESAEASINQPSQKAAHAGRGALVVPATACIEAEQHQPMITRGFGNPERACAAWPMPWTRSPRSPKLDSFFCVSVNVRVWVWVQTWAWEGVGVLVCWGRRVGVDCGSWSTGSAPETRSMRRGEARCGREMDHSAENRWRSTRCARCRMPEMVTLFVA